MESIEALKSFEAAVEQMSFSNRADGRWKIWLHTNSPYEIRRASKAFFCGIKQKLADFFEQKNNGEFFADESALRIVCENLTNPALHSPPLTAPSNKEKRQRLFNAIAKRRNECNFVADTLLKAHLSQRNGIHVLQNYAKFFMENASDGEFADILRKFNLYFDKVALKIDIAKSKAANFPSALQEIGIAAKYAQYPFFASLELDWKIGQR